MIYVDPLMDNGWRLGPNCHLFSEPNGGEQPELHAFAARLGLKRAWFQRHRLCDHYDLTAGRRAAAVAAGAIECTRTETVAIWRRKRGET